MKITKSQLKRIIQEELQQILQEQETTEQKPVSKTSTQISDEEHAEFLKNLPKYDLKLTTGKQGDVVKPTPVYKVKPNP